MSEQMQNAERMEESPLDGMTRKQVKNDTETVDGDIFDGDEDKDKAKGIEERIIDGSDSVADNVRRGFGTQQTRLLVRVLICGLLVCSAFIFFAGIMKYNHLTAEKKELQEELDKNNSQIEELEYLIDSPVDYDYVVRIAKEKLNLHFPDEIVYYNDYKK